MKKLTVIKIINKNNLAQALANGQNEANPVL